MGISTPRRQLHASTMPWFIMSQDWKNREILVEMRSGWRSSWTMITAALYYTEARLSEMAGYLCRISKEYRRSFAWNFDDTEKEPNSFCEQSLSISTVNGATGFLLVMRLMTTS